MSFHTGDVIDVTVVDVAQGGWCVARPEEGPVVFVRHALPGERVRARVTEVTTRFARAEAVQILDPSPDRVQAPCPSARPDGCGGCDWQHASLPAQRALKAAVVAQHLRRLAGVDREVIVEPLPGDEPGDEPVDEPGDGDGPGFGWRTRVQFAVRGDGLAGLRGHRSHEIVDVGDCLIAHPGIRDLGIPRLRWEGASGVEAIVAADIATADAEAVDEAADAEAAAAADAADAEAKEDADDAANGPERAVIVSRDDGRRGGRPHGRRAVAAGDGRAARNERGARGEREARSHREPEGLTAVTASTVLSRAGRRLTPLRGRPYLTHHAAGRDWRVSAGSFWQVHPAAADTLAAVVLEALDPRPGDVALDLYCGAGLFAGVIAPRVGLDGAVIGIESDEDAVRDARNNLREWPRARFHRGDVAQVLRRGGLPLARLAVADPPRAGLDRAVVDYLSAAGTERFAYVSCDPATLSRDIGLLRERGWTMDGLRAFDAFPMTHHVECVAVLTR
ncbi:MAG TPA: TRAM domain-containing protein [Trebonia sp.]|nr:TRAM domain-containing protein [Trebonia sp.]